MKKTNAIKTFLLGALGFMALGFAACNSSSETDEFTGFLPGAQTVMTTGDSIFIEEIVDKVESGEYTITISGNGKVEDVTDKVGWRAITTGTYVITYTVESGANKGTYTHTIEVLSPEYIKVSRHLEPMIFLYEQEVTFDEIFEQLDVTVTSHRDYQLVMLSVRVDDTLLTFDEDQTSYRIESFSEHNFAYAIRTMDGRERKFIAPVTVKYSYDEREVWVDENANGQYVIEQSDVANISINGEACAADDIQITATGIALSECALHDKYSGVNNVCLTTKSGEEIRIVLNVYTEYFDMENGLPDGIFYFNDWSSNDGMKMVQHNGSQALQMWGANQWQRFYLNGKYLDFIFANESIDVFSFDVFVEFEAATNATSIELVFYMPNENKIRVWCNNGETATVKITRKAYDEWVSKDRTVDGVVVDMDVACQFNNTAGRTGIVQLNWYVDNMQGGEQRFDGTFETMTDIDLSWGTAYGKVTSVNLVADPVNETNKVLKLEKSNTHENSYFTLNVSDTFAAQAEVGKILSYKAYGVRGNADDVLVVRVKAENGTGGAFLHNEQIIVAKGENTSSDWVDVGVVLDETMVANIKANKCLCFMLKTRGEITDGSAEKTGTFYLDDINIHDQVFDGTFENMTMGELVFKSVFGTLPTATLAKSPTDPSGKALKVVTNAGSGGQYMGIMLPESFLANIAEGKTISYKVYAERANTNGVLITRFGTSTNLFNVDAQAVVVAAGETQSNGWVEISVVLTAEQAAAIKENGSITFYFKTTASDRPTATYYVDNISINE